MHNILKTFALILLSTIVGNAQDSTVVRDFELWTGVTVKKSFLDKKLNLALTEEFRFHDNATSINNYFTEVEAGYEFYKGFDLGLGYRYIKNNRKSGYESLGRIYTDLSYKHKISPLTLNYRFRYQNQQVLGSSKTDSDYAMNKYRLKVKATYNIKKWKLDPYISSELFYAQTRNRITYIDGIEGSVDKINALQKYRLTLGTEYKITKYMEVGAFYRIERELKSYPLFYNTPATYYIAGINMTFKF